MQSVESIFLGFYMPSGWEWLVILAIALLIFGKKLPDVGRSLGKGIVEFKKGLKGVKEELDEVEREVETASKEAEKGDDQRQLEASETEDFGAADSSGGQKEQGKASTGAT